jgi:hypothetical protein
MPNTMLQGSGLLNINSTFNLNLMNQGSTVNFGNPPNSNPFYEVLNIEKNSNMNTNQALYKNLYNNKTKANQKKQDVSSNSIFK